MVGVREEAEKRRNEQETFVKGAILRNLPRRYIASVSGNAGVVCSDTKKVAKRKTVAEAQQLPPAPKSATADERQFLLYKEAAANGRPFYKISFYSTT